MDYDESVELIKNIEAQDTAQHSVVVSLAESEDKVNVRQYSEKEVAALVNSMEKLLGPMVATGQPQAPEQAGAIIQEAALQNPDVARIEAADVIEERAKTSKHFDAAGKELEKAIAQVQNKMAKMTEKKSEQRLILPTLSLSDQVSELEKISFGIDGNVFTPEQRKIIIAEVQGLSRKKDKPVGELEKELAGIRDKRLTEVMDKLGIK